jgi:flagellar M-ring protein FliF
MELLDKVRAKWTDLSKTKKSVIIVGITCLVLSAYLFYRWMTKVDYAPLFTNMQAESAGKIAENLKAMNVPYKLGDAGKTILVPKDQVYEIRLDLASKGIMSDSSYGFELFDKSDMGATDFERNVNYQRALQEELRRSIVQIDAVKQARVHLVIPEKSAFIENEHKPQASIVLELKPMVKLQPEQIKAIAELAAGSVENLKVEDVNIIDTSGNVLSDEMQNNGNTAQELNQMELKRNYEKDLEKRLQQFLDNIYAPIKL